MFILINTIKLQNIENNLTYWRYIMAENIELKEMAEKASETAKNIWLAGLGAYGKALDEAQEKYGEVSEKVNKESSRLFEELVAKGKKLEGDTSEKLTEAKEKSTASLEERLSQVKESLSFSKADESTDKLDEISNKLDLVIEALGAKKAPVKKTATKKAAASSEKTAA